MKNLVILGSGIGGTAMANMLSDNLGAEYIADSGLGDESIFFRPIPKSSDQKNMRTSSLWMMRATFRRQKRHPSRTLHQRPLHQKED